LKRYRLRQNPVCQEISNPLSDNAVKSACARRTGSAKRPNQAAITTFVGDAERSPEKRKMEVGNRPEMLHREDRETR
jgi:hypothetical protein